MDQIDRMICEIVQRDGRTSSATIAEAVGLPVSTANDRLRRLDTNKVISSWRGILDPARVGAELCAFLLVDMTFDGEAVAVEALRSRREVLELHHISGAHSYLVKIRVADMAAVQRFLGEVVKPLSAVQRTETIFALETLKETTEILIAPAALGTKP